MIAKSLRREPHPHLCGGEFVYRLEWRHDRYVDWVLVYWQLVLVGVGVGSILLMLLAGERMSVFGVICVCFAELRILDSVL